MLEQSQRLQTLQDVLNFMAPSLGGSVPDENSEEFSQWLLAIQVKYEEASRRGFWRRLLTKDTVSLTEGDESIMLPARFQRANSLYIFYVDGVDLADPDRTPDDQDIFAEQINDPDDLNFGRWRITFSTPVEETQTAPIWYFATPPFPEDLTDKILLPGDMVAYGAMSEIFRHTNLEGSLDDARIEYENRLATYLAMEEIPERNKLLTFVTNPKGLNRTDLARQQYSSGRATRSYRMNRSF